jgi:hypothetical protein
MAEYKNYNLFALQGDTETTDIEVCSNLGLNPLLAGTPEINEAAIKKMHKENYDTYVKRGDTEEDASRLSDAAANKTRKKIRALMP